MTDCTSIAATGTVRIDGTAHAVTLRFEVAEDYAGDWFYIRVSYDDLPAPTSHWVDFVNAVPGYADLVASMPAGEDRAEQEALLDARRAAIEALSGFDVEGTVKLAI